MQFLRAGVIAGALAVVLVPMLALAESPSVAAQVLAKARVVEVTRERIEEIQGLGAPRHIQTISAEILEGPEKGMIATFENDFTQLAVGDVFYLRHLTNEVEGTDFYSVADPYRLHVLGGLLIAFLLLLFLFGGFQGLRGLLALAGSFVLIFYLLLPGIAAGLPPLLVAVSVASLVIVLGSYITHGYNRTTTSAVLGMIATVVLTGALAWLSVDASAFSGFNSDEATQLNFQFNGSLDLIGILLSGVIIGLLGVLYDVAIGQAVSVEELLRAGKHLSRRTVYNRALRIGREHIGALVNTLAIAYVGAALPLFLLLYRADASWAYLINGEIIATEVVRILIGGIGIILAVPLTTLIAVLLIREEDARKEAPGRHSHQ